MIRLFVAIDPADNVAERLKSICLGLPGARWVPAKQMHLTLCFIGEVEGNIFRDVREALAGLGSRFHSTATVLKELNGMPL